MEIKEQMKRWRLILGEESQVKFEEMDGSGEAALSEEQWLMDQALAAIYNKNSAGGFSNFGPGGRGAGKGPSADYPVAGRRAYLV